MANQNSGAQRAEAEKSDSSDDLSKEAKKRLAEVEKSDSSDDLSKEAKKRLDEAAQSKAASEEAAKDTGYKVAPGRSVVTRRGIIDGGEAIGPLDCAPSRDKREQGTARLEELMRRGYVVKTK